MLPDIISCWCASFSKGLCGTVLWYYWIQISFGCIIVYKLFEQCYVMELNFFGICIWAVFETVYYFWWLYAYGIYFLFLLCPLWSIILTVITSFKVGSFWLNGLLCHLLNVNKDIYEFFPWKKKLYHWNPILHNYTILN